jgi:hypothetical protein
MIAFEELLSQEAFICPVFDQQTVVAIVSRQLGLPVVPIAAKPEFQFSA